MLHRTLLPSLRRRLGLVVSGAFALTGFLWSATAAADAKATVAGDLDYAIPIDSSADSGGGFGIRLGERIHIPLVVINPEFGFTYHSFGGASSPKVYRGTVGLRIGIGEIFRPGVFGHLGIARLDLASVPDLSHTAFTYDGGVFLDFTALPLLDVGVHAAYNRVAADDHVSAFQFATLGAHAALVF